MSEKRDTPEQEAFRRHCQDWLTTNNPFLGLNQRQAL
jgi:hypothetical protein